jgi:hypothetical protein
MTERNYSLIATGMVAIGMLYSTDPEEQANTIAQVLLGKYDDEIAAAFAYHHGDEAGTKMLTELKDEFRKTLQFAFDKEADRLKAQQVEDAAEQFMGNHEPHPLGTVSELSEQYNVSKKEIRRLKQSGQLEAFVNERT